nr:hypothetical protein [Streptomyces sp. ISL-99]
MSTLEAGTDGGQVEAGAAQMGMALEQVCQHGALGAADIGDGAVGRPVDRLGQGMCGAHGQAGHGLLEGVEAVGVVVEGRIVDGWRARVTDSLTLGTAPVAAEDDRARHEPVAPRLTQLTAGVRVNVALARFS